MPHLRTVRLWISCLTMLAASGLTNAAEVAPPVVPDGFTIEKAVQSPLIQRPIFAAFDQDGFLFVGESNGENLKRDDMLAKKPHWITRLEDTNGDGVFDKSVKFVENITLPQGMLCYRGSVYAACPPSIWKFTDTDGDGKADQRQEILTGFGFSGNACDTHGPFLSPTGRLYIAQGRHGHEFKDKEGKTYSKGKAARIYSCRLDGSDVRVHCGGGFDNPVEIDFTEEGEAIGTVNILYRDRGDCLMHWVEGGVYPREDQADCVAEFKWTGGLLGPIHNLGHVACSGLMRYRGVHFGDEFKNRWFFTEFNTHKVRSAELKRSGSTFTADVHEFLTSSSPDFHPTDVLEDADGSLLVVDTGAWFLNGCPTSRVSKPEDLGAIWRVRKTGGKTFDDPRGKKLELAKLTPAEWARLLEDQRTEVREAALKQLARLKYSEAFFAVGRATPETGELSLPTSRRLIQFSIMQQEPYWVMVDCNSKETSLRLAAAYAAGDYESLPPPYQGEIQTSRQVKNDLYENAIMLLTGAQIRLLEKDAAVQFASVHSLCQLIPRMDAELRKKCTPTISDALLEGITRRKADRFLEHQTTVALIRLSHPEPLVKTLRDGSAIQRRVGLIALDQMENSPLTREMVVPLLSTDDPALLAAVLEVISRREGWSAETLSLFKGWLREGEATTEQLATIRSFLTAQARDARVQRWVADLLTDAAVTGAERIALLDVMQQAFIDAWPSAWSEPLLENLKHPQDDVKLKSLEVVMARDLGEFVEAVRSVGGSASQRSELRGLAFAFVLAHQKKEVSHCLFAGTRNAFTSDDWSPRVRAATARGLARAPLSDAQLKVVADLLPKAGPLAAPLALPAFARSQNEAVGLQLVSVLAQHADSLNVAPDELASILRRYPASVQQAAAGLLKKLGVDPEAQRLKLEELAPLLEGGDANAGRAVFLSKKANCAACHRAEGVSPTAGRAGPDLSKIGLSRSSRDLLEAIVFPSASFVNGYRPHIVATNSGKTVTGVISSKTTDTITLKLQDLTEVKIARRDIDEMKEGSTSIMPKGLDTQLTPEELRNLLAYLRARR